MSHEAKCSVYSELDYMEIHISVFLNLSYPFPFSAPSRLSTICRLSFSHTADTGNCGYYYRVLLCMLTKETAAALPYAEEQGAHQPHHRGDGRRGGDPTKQNWLNATLKIQLSRDLQLLFGVKTCYK